MTSKIGFVLAATLGVALMTMAFGCGDDGGGGTQDASQDLAGVGSVSGTVTLSDGGDPSGAELELAGQFRTADATGAFAFDAVAPGEHPISATLTGYVSYAGTVSVSAGENTVHDLALQPVQADNLPPSIASFGVEPAILARRGSAVATVVATDPDDDALTYDWTASGGFSVQPRTTPGTATVTAPAGANATGTVTVTVSDPRGGTDSASQPVATSSNQAPTLTELSADPATVAPGETTVLTAAATDPDGDAVTFEWAVDETAWSLVPDNGTAFLTAVNAFGATATVTVTVRDDLDGVTIQTLEVSTSPCGGSLVDCDGNAANGCERANSGLGPACPADSCRRILLDGYASEDGVYWLDLRGRVAPFETYCDLSTEGGGWTLLGTISGADDHHWNTRFGYWTNGTTLGSAADPWLDFKSQAWIDFDISEASLMMQRRYDGVVRAQSLLSNACIASYTRFTQPFQIYDTTRSCTAAAISVLSSDPTGLASPDFQEGVGMFGLGTATTNGLCWNGEDTALNTFQGHVVWVGDPSAGNCSQGTHAGGLGVFQNGGAPFTNADITGTSWLFGTDFSLTDISIFAREVAILEGSLTKASPGQWSDGTFARSCAEYRNPGTTYEYRGATVGDGIYRIDVDGPDNPAPPTNVFCDMTTDGGGWVAIAANGDNTLDETTAAADCYPLITGDPARGCGDPTNLLEDFTLSGAVQAGIAWQQLLGIAYGDTGYSEKLAYFGVQFSVPLLTSEERVNGALYTPSGLSTTYGPIACGASHIAHYVRAGTYVSSPEFVANGKGTVFGHSSAMVMDSDQRLTLGFTDARDTGGDTTSLAGLDDYEDGWGCGDNWVPQAARGARMVVLVR